MGRFSRARWLVAPVLMLLVLLCGVSTAFSFSNGQATRDQLAQAHTDQANQTAYLSKDFGSALNDMRFCANRAGVSITGNYSQFHPAATYYRDLRVQQILINTLRPQGVLVAPLAHSNHGFGTALDAAPSTIRWFQLHGWRWHVYKTEAFVEPWHWNYTGGKFKFPDPGIDLQYPVLRTGSGGRCLGPAVKELQRLLGVEVSGGFGDGTRRVLKEKQRDLICKKCGTGVVGKTTWKVLRTHAAPRHQVVPKYVQLTKPVRMRGQNVLAVIGNLNARRKEQRKFPLSNDGSFGTKDSRALKNFQRSRHLEPSGIAGPKTLSALRTPSQKTQQANLHRVASAQKAGFEVKSVAKAQKDYGCAKVHSKLKRQTCKVRVLRGQWQRRDHYAQTLHGHERGVWMTRAKHTRKNYNAAKATLHKLERPVHVTNEGVNIVASFEGLYHRCYNDGATAAGGYATIGLGHLLHYSVCTAHDRTLYWSTSKSYSMLAKDLRQTERAVVQMVKVRINQHEFNALVSVGFNIGTGGLRNSTLIRYLNAGNKQGAADQFMVWNKAGGRVLLGLTRRRAAERAMFLR